MKIKSVLSTFLVSIILLGGINVAAEQNNDDFYYTENKSYSEYIKNFQSNEYLKEINVDIFNFDSASVSAGLTVADGEKSVKIQENGSLTLNVDVPKSGYYNIRLGYCPPFSGSSTTKFRIKIDGEIPFAGADTLILKGIWQENKNYEEDSQGNQIRKSAEQSTLWCNKTVSDSTGLSREPYIFYFTEGTHKLTINVYQNSMILKDLRLCVPEEQKTYSQIKEEYKQKGYQNAVKSVTFEAENPDYKSDRSIVIVSDKTSPNVKPSSAAKIRYNTIGSGSWKTVGEWVEWTVNAPQDGLYTISAHFKQDIKTGNVSFRKLYLDGVVPFKEAEELPFRYGGNWQTETFGDENGDYLFYLKKGEHKLRLEAVLGSFAPHLLAVSDALSELNRIYTDIVMVTGPNPDIERDYQFEKAIPEVIQKINRTSDNLKAIEKNLLKLTGEKGGQSTVAIKRLYTSMDKMVKNPESISRRLNNYLTDITSLATWLNESREQPLQLDSITLGADNGTAKISKGELLRFLGYHAKQFIYSFIIDYANVGNKNTDNDVELRVWVGTGRDQADITRSLINEDFIPKNNIGANVQLVNIGSLLPATLARIGPDVYLSISEEQPVDYALRHAVVNLRDFEDCDEVLKRFYNNALSSFYLDDGLYALPETMSYPVLFYRKDILTSLGIKKSDLETWQGLLQKVLPELDMNYFNFGVPANLKFYANLLYQNGGQLYKSDGTACNLNSPEAVTSFKMMTSLFNDYGLPKAYDFANRFRSGQMPLAIAEYTSYNQLSVFAPEIEGLWEMLPIPGIKDDSGNLNRTAVCTVTGAVILSNSQYKKESWEFLKWWTSADTQSRYAGELESVMGTGARYASANIEAMQSVDWSRTSKTSLNKQLESVIGMPYIAGSYYTTRSFDFAFRDVVYNKKDLRECLTEANENINGEISEKRKEFYLKRGEN